MKIIAVIIAAAGLAMSAAYVQQGVKPAENLPDKEAEAMYPTYLEACDFYGECTVTDTAACRQQTYAGRLDADTKALVLEFLSQGERSHRLNVDAKNTPLSDSPKFKITAKDPKTHKEYTIAPGDLLNAESGEKRPVILLDCGKDIRCYADEHSYCREYDDFRDDNAGFSESVGFYVEYDLKKPELKISESSYTPKTGKPGIIVLQHYTNNAWYHADEGTFVDMNGNIYGFSYSSQEFEDSPYSDLMTELNKIYNAPDTKPIGAYPDTAVFEQLADYAEKIDPDAEITYQQAAFDAGQNTTYLIRSDGKKVFVHSTGDSDETSTDKYADMAYTILQR